MAKQSRLEREAINKREELEVRLDYHKGEGAEYNENHPDAMSDGDPLGKGTGVPMGYSVPGETESKAINYSNMETSRGGGLYDIEGRNNVGGRLFLNKINLYTPNSYYGEDSVDTSKNVMEHNQFQVRY